MNKTNTQKHLSLKSLKVSGETLPLSCKSKLILKVVCGLVFIVWSVNLFGQFPQERIFDLPLDAGVIEHIEEDPVNNLVYYAGKFKNFGLPLENYALLNTGHDSIISSFPFTTEISPHPPRSNTTSAVTCVAAVQNGWYVGGYFTRFKHQDLKYLAFIDENGIVNEPPFKPNGEVKNMYWQDSLLVISGDFTMMNDVPKHRLAVINTNTNELLPNTPGLVVYNGFSGDVKAMDIDGSEIFLSGTLTIAGNLTTGSILVDPVQDSILFPATGDDVDAVIPDNQGGWFIGGAFTQYGSKQRKSLAQIDSLGRVTDFNFEFDGGISALALHNDTLYISGSFTFVNGEHRPNLAAIDLISQELTPLKTEVDGTISKLAVNDESIVIAGDYNWVGNTWENTTQLDIQSMSVERLYDSPNSSNIYHIVSDGFGGWFIVGNFTKVGSETRTKIAHINEDGYVSDWQLSPSISINNSNLDLFKRIDDKLLIGGNFDSDSTSSDLICVSTITGEYLPLNLELSGSINDAFKLGDQLIIGGDLDVDSVGEVISCSMARYSFLQDTVTLFENYLPGEVEALITDGNKIFVLGTFETEDGTNWQSIKCYDALTSEEQPFQIESNGPIQAVYLKNDQLFVQGSFTEINEQERNHIAAFDVNSLELTPWTLQNVELLSGFPNEGEIKFDNEYIYLTAAEVTNTPGWPARLIRADINSGQADEEWNLRANNSAYLSLRAPFDLHNGKIFTRVGNTQGYRGVCALDRSGNYTHWIDSLANQNLYQLEWHNDFLYARNIHGITRYDADGKKDNWAITDGELAQGIRSFKIVSDRVVMSGFSMIVNGEERKGLATADLESGELLPVSFFENDDSNIQVSDFDVHQDIIYAVFANASFNNPNYVRAFDLFTGEENSELTPEISNYSDNYRPHINFSGDKFLVFLNRYGGESMKLFSFNSISGELTDYTSAVSDAWSFNPQLITKLKVKENKLILSRNSSFYVLDKITKEPLWNNTLSFSNDFEVLGDSLIITRYGSFTPNPSHIFSIDLNNGTLNPWSPIDTESAPNSLSWVNGKLVIGGSINLPGYEESFEFVYLDTVSGEILPYASPHFNIDLDYNGVDVENPETKFYSNEYGTLLKGDFSGMNRIHQNNILSRNTLTGQVTDWAPQLGITGESNPDITITGMHLYGDSIYISGTFTEVNEIERPGFASIHRFTGEVGNWNPSFPDESDIRIWGFDDKLIFTGTIDNAFQETRDMGALIHLNDHSLSPLNLDVPVSFCVLTDDTLFVHGDFDESFGQMRYDWASYRASTGELLPWSVSPYFYSPTGGNSGSAVVTDSTVIIRSGYSFSGPEYALRTVDRNSGVIMEELNTENLIIDDGAMVANNQRLYFVEMRNVPFLSEPRGSLNYYHFNDNEISVWRDTEHFHGEADISFDNNLLFANHKIYEVPACAISLQCSDTIINLSESVLELNAQDLITSSESTCGDLSFSLDINSLSCDDIGVNTIQVTAISSTETFQTCMAEVQLIDTIGPNVECNNLVVELNHNNLPELEMSDLISGSISPCEVATLSIDTDLNFTCDQAGSEVEIQVEVLDLSGNISVCTSQVSIALVDPDEDGIDASCDLCFGDDSSGDSDGDGICDDSEITGCQDPAASNYNPLATHPGICFYELNVDSELPFTTTTGLGGRPDSGFKVYPNPLSTGEVTVVFDEPLINSSKVFVYDPLGRKVFEGAMQKDQVSFAISSDHFLAQGVYLILIAQGSGKIFSNKVLVTK